MNLIIFLFFKTGYILFFKLFLKFFNIDNLSQRLLNYSVIKHSIEENYFIFFLRKYVLNIVIKKIYKLFNVKNFIYPAESHVDKIKLRSY